MNHQDDGLPRAYETVTTLLRLVAAFAASVVVVLALFVFALWLWWLDDPADDQRSRGVNALWISHTWVGDRHSDDDYRALADLLHRNEISDALFHAGPLDGDGGVPDDLIVHAVDLLAAMDRFAPDVTVQAYLGQIEERGGGSLDLDDPAVRDGIVATAERFLDMGFEGIHYDIEPIYPGDDSFLDLLDHTRALTEPRHAVLSVALEQMEPAPGAQRAISTVWRGYHDPTKGFLQDVAARVDQVAIMTYDSGQLADWLFGAHTAWQTEWVIDAIGGDVTVFMGVPTYSEHRFMKFYPWAENVDSGIRGVRKGLDRFDRDRTQNVGIAIYAEWTTSEGEWASYASEWLPR